MHWLKSMSAANRIKIEFINLGNFFLAKIQAKLFYKNPSKVILPKCPTVFLHPISASEMSPQLFSYDPILAAKMFPRSCFPLLESLKPGPSNFWPCCGESLKSLPRFSQSPLKPCRSCFEGLKLRGALKLRLPPSKGKKNIFILKYVRLISILIKMKIYW